MLPAAPSAWNPQQRDVDGRIGADDLAAERPAVRHRDGDPLGALDDVLVGEDEALAIDDEPAARALPGGLEVARPVAVVRRRARAADARASLDVASILTTAALMRSATSAKLTTPASAAPPAWPRAAAAVPRGADDTTGARREAARDDHADQKRHDGRRARA